MWPIDGKRFLNYCRLQIECCEKKFDVLFSYRRFVLGHLNKICWSIIWFVHDWIIESGCHPFNGISFTVNLMPIKNSTSRSTTHQIGYGIFRMPNKYCTQTRARQTTHTHMCAMCMHWKCVLLSLVLFLLLLLLLLLRLLLLLYYIVEHLSQLFSKYN